ncbi:ATP-binding protein [Amycolatopsis sp. NPDC005961]|uniref:ATP-binding protein n=1 Tax=Amycolatopsis sp. NPDC005961 TaxID=3156720 RepID=UPI0033C1A0E1
MVKAQENVAQRLEFRLRRREAVEPDGLREAIHQQLLGIPIEESATGTMLRVSLPTGRTLDVVLSAVSTPGQVTANTSIELENTAELPAGTVPQVPSAISDELQHYLSAAYVASAQDTEGILKAEQRLARLHGIPANDVVGDIVTRLRDDDWFHSWAANHHGRSTLDVLRAVQESTSLILLHGDPGTGKSALMHAVAPVCARVLGQDTLFVQLNERLRGQGIQGRAGSELIEVIETIYQAAARHSLPTVVFLDEADAVASSRGSSDTGSGAQENLAIVDGLIVALDRASGRSGARLVFVMATNLPDRIDPAVLRRATVYPFERPSADAQLHILTDLLGDIFPDKDLRRVHKAFSRPEHSLTAADIVNQVVTRAVREAVAQNQPVRLDRLVQLAELAVAGSPVVSARMLPSAALKQLPAGSRR